MSDIHYIKLTATNNERKDGSPTKGIIQAF